MQIAYAPFMHLGSRRLSRGRHRALSPERQAELDCLVREAAHRELERLIAVHRVHREHAASRPVREVDYDLSPNTEEPE